MDVGQKETEIKSEREGEWEKEGEEEGEKGERERGKILCTLIVFPVHGSPSYLLNSLIMQEWLLK